MTIWREEQIGDCRLILGDATDCLAALRDAACVLTDPPFGISYHSNYRTDVLWDGDEISGDNSVALRDYVLARLHGRPMLVFGSWKAPRPPGTRAVLIWDQGRALGMGALDIPWKPSAQEIYVIGKGFVGSRDEGAVLQCAPVQSTASNGRLHPNERELHTLLPPGQSGGGLMPTYIHSAGTTGSGPAIGKPPSVISIAAAPNASANIWPYIGSGDDEHRNPKMGSPCSLTKWTRRNCRFFVNKTRYRSNSFAYVKLSELPSSKRITAVCGIFPLIMGVIVLFWCANMCLHDVNFSSSAVRSRASAASFSNFADRSVATATAFSASATRLSSAVLARFRNHNSPHTPPKISKFAPIEATIFQLPSRMNNATISTSNPSRIKYASLSAHKELKSETDFRSLRFVGPSILGYIRPRGRRSAGLIWAAGACTIFTAMLFIYALCRAVWG